MPMASQYRPEERIFALFCGRSGDGKSVAAASFARPLIDLDFDFRFGGIKAAMDQGIISSEDVEYEQYSPILGWAPVDKWLTQQKSFLLQGQFKYKTIICDSITSLARLLVVTSHVEQKGRTIGALRISGPGDFNFEQSGTHQVFDHLRSFRCNVIATAHVIDKYGKLDPSKEYSESGIVGEKLSIRDNLGENLQTYFDNVFRFSREVISNQVHYYVEFASSLAKNTYGIPPGRYDITNKNFHDFLQGLIAKIKAEKTPKS